MDKMLELNYDLLNWEAKRQAIIEVYKELYKKELEKQIYCLEKTSKLEAVVKYFIENVDKKITKTDLRNLNIYSKNKFKKMFEANYHKIMDALIDKGYYLNVFYPDRNTQVFICTKNK